MSYAICRVQKIKGASSVHGVQTHQRRDRTVSHSNPDIDWSRTDFNYSLIGGTDKPFNALADERIQNAYRGTKSIRKDAVRVVSGLFTSDNGFFQGKTPYEQRRFFEDCFAWACERFGKDNIISAVVHNDEETPHLHIEFVPLTTDGRLSAKAVLGGRVDLQRMQDDFYNKVGKPWGLERGERVDLDSADSPKPRKHLDTKALKQKTSAEVKALEVRKQELESEANWFELECIRYNQELTTIRAELEALELELANLRQKSDKVKTGADIMLEDRDEYRIEKLSAELDESLKNPLKLVLKREELKSIFDEMTKLVKKAHKTTEKASSMAFKQWEHCDKALEANKNLAKIADRVPELEKTIAAQKQEKTQLKQRIRDYDDLYNRVRQFLDSKGLKRECNAFIAEQRALEQQARYTAKEELVIHREAERTDFNRGRSR